MYSLEDCLAATREALEGAPGVVSIALRRDGVIVIAVDFNDLDRERLISLFLFKHVSAELDFEFRQPKSTDYLEG